MYIHWTPLPAPPFLLSLPNEIYMYVGTSKQIQFLFYNNSNFHFVQCLEGAGAHFPFLQISTSEQSNFHSWRLWVHSSIELISIWNQPTPLPNHRKGEGQDVPRQWPIHSHVIVGIAAVVVDVFRGLEVVVVREGEIVMKDTMIGVVTVLILRRVR